MIWYQFTSDWYHFYFHQIYADFTANNKIKIHYPIASASSPYELVTNISQYNTNLKVALRNKEQIKER